MHQWLRYGARLSLIELSCHPVRLIKHTKKLMDKEEKLCIKILQTLREMLDKKDCIQESVSNCSALY